jgi:hypothetical protein
MRFNSVEEILQHSWLAGTDIQQILQKKLVPPFPTNMFESNVDDTDFARD